jgi:hypothetical protein
LARMGPQNIPMPFKRTRQKISRRPIRLEKNIAIFLKLFGCNFVGQSIFL